MPISQRQSFDVSIPRSFCKRIIQWIPTPEASDCMCMRPWSPNPLNKCHTLAHVLVGFKAPSSIRFQGAMEMPPCKAHWNSYEPLVSSWFRGFRGKTASIKADGTLSSDIYGLWVGLQCSRELFCLTFISLEAHFTSMFPTPRQRQIHALNSGSIQSSAFHSLSSGCI